VSTLDGWLFGSPVVFNTNACLAAYTNILRINLNATCITTKETMACEIMAEKPISGDLINTEVFRSKPSVKSCDKNHMRGS